MPRTHGSTSPHHQNDVCKCGNELKRKQEVAPYPSFGEGSGYLQYQPGDMLRVTHASGDEARKLVVEIAKQRSPEGICVEMFFERFNPRFQGLLKNTKIIILKSIRFCKIINIRWSIHK